MPTQRWNIATALVCLVGFATTCQSDAQVDFNRDIRPILSNKCFACHGPDPKSREAGLRLDMFEGATEDLGGYQAVTPGEPDQSELIVRVTSEDQDDVMPPPSHGKPVTRKEQQLLRDWIKGGGKYSLHWSYNRPVRPAVPSKKWAAGRDRLANEIDAFTYARMRQYGLSPSQPADRHAIIRRLSLDLTGLPPSPEQVSQFVNDTSENAYEQLVDRLIGQPAFGERWATVWLDLARYADSAGYAEDRRRTIWAFRDYVIRSLNQNKPFDQFTREQIAGDLLPDPTQEQLIATAFHRNTLTNSEGGTSDEEFRNAAVIDRVNTTMAVWMGTTMACAQCHTHKYDPITQQEYFEFFAFFNATADNDRPNEVPLMDVFQPGDLLRRQKLLAEIDKLKAKGPSESLSDEQLETWIARLSKSKPVSGRYVRVELVGRVGILSLAEVQVFSGKDNLAAKGKARQSSVDYEGPAKLAIDGNTAGDFTKKSVTHTRNEKNPWWELDLGSPQTIDRVTLWNRTGPGMTVRLNDCRITILDTDRKSVWQQDFPKALPRDRNIEVNSPPRSIIEIASRPGNERTADQTAKLRKYAWENSDPYRKQVAAIAKLNAELNAIKKISTIPVMKELAKPRETRIQIRGNYLDTDKTVNAATPGIFHKLPDGSKRDRRALAEWLSSNDNPLTARVVANRFWEQIFGMGIVSTSEEFGNQGELPSHPRLLDYLAVEFMESGWDQKALIKKMVMSATYRQSSATTPDQLRQDPNNRWLSRGPRKRLTAEMVRDQALFVSGLISQKMYGPPVQPPQPKFGLKAAFSGSVDWNDSTGPDRYRRAIYTEWRRSAPYPSMTTFDKSNLEVCEIKRAQTNTPLQALVTLNDPVYVEAAQALARKITRSHPDAPPEVIAEYAFRLCLIRKPSQQEVGRIVKLFKEAREHFESQPDKAALLATDPLHPLPKNANLLELAAWTTVANVILNLDEMFQKP